MFAISKKEAPKGIPKILKKADPSHRLRQNHLNFEASFTPDDIIGNNFPQAWNKLLDMVKKEVNFFKKKKH